MRSLVARTIVLGGVLGAGWATGCTGTEHAEDAPSVVASRILVPAGGSIDLVDDAVVALTTSSSSPICTGTLVSSRLVLTAGHCVDGEPPAKVYVGTTIPGGGTWLSVAGTMAHPEYDPADFRLADVGAVLLETRAPVAPLAYAGQSVSAGDSIRLVGFGYQATGPSGDRGQKLTASAPVALVTENELEYGAVACNGDSGGPVLSTGAGPPEVVGVISWADSRCALRGGAARVDRHAAWLDQLIAEFDPPSCERDFRCQSAGGACGGADPDCPCAPDDGTCSPDCAVPELDPDCPAGCGAGDECVPGCPRPDPDCGHSCMPDGFCVPGCAVPDTDCVRPGAPPCADAACGAADGAPLAEPISCAITPGGPGSRRTPGDVWAGPLLSLLALVTALACARLRPCARSCGSWSPASFMRPGSRPERRPPAPRSTPSREPR